jgi:hypothetical protein
MTILWLMKFLMVSFPLFSGAGEVNQRVLPSAWAAKQVTGLVVVGESVPVIIYQK